MTKPIDARVAATDRFLRCLNATDVWSEDVTQAYDALCVAFGFDPLPPKTKTYAAARKLAAELVKGWTAHAAAVKQADVEFLDVVKKARGK